MFRNWVSLEILVRMQKPYDKPGFYLQLDVKNYPEELTTKTYGNHQGNFSQFLSVILKKMLQDSGLNTRSKGSLR